MMQPKEQRVVLSTHAVVMKRIVENLVLVKRRIRMPIRKRMRTMIRVMRKITIIVRMR